MRPFRTVRAALGAAAAAALCSGLLGACDTSPDVATVNGTAISESQLLNQLQSWASSPYYVRIYDSVAAQTAQANNQQTAPTVLGSGSGTYNRAWTDEQLTGMVQQLAIAQALLRQGKGPNDEQRQAAWAAEWAFWGPAWPQFPSRLRDEVAGRDAEQAVLDTVGNKASVASFYQQHHQEFWTKVCVRSIDVGVDNSDGSLNRGASLAKARQLTSQLSGGSQSAAASGAVNCSTPEQLISQPASELAAIDNLAVGKVAQPLSEAYGYQVLEVVSRQTLPLDQTVATVIGVVQQGGSAQEAIRDPAVISILKKARITVNSDYGRWETHVQQYPPFILPAGEQINSAPSGT